MRSSKNRARYTAALSNPFDLRLGLFLMIKSSCRLDFLSADIFSRVFNQQNDVCECTHFRTPPTTDFLSNDNLFSCRPIGRRQINLKSIKRIKHLYIGWDQLDWTIGRWSMQSARSCAFHSECTDCSHVTLDFSFIRALPMRLPIANTGQCDARRLSFYLESKFKS